MIKHLAWVPSRWLAMALVCFAGLEAFALGPHEVLLLVNARSSRSLEAANHYAEERRIPAQNIVRLDLPDETLAPAAEMSPADFTRLIWTPALSAMKERGLDKQITAWIYSLDFPARITSDPPVSLQGITFVRNQLPDPELIKMGQYGSKLFAGPDKPGGPQAPSRSLDRCLEPLGSDRPLPSMLLGVAGSRGMETADILNQLHRAWTADKAGIPGAVYFQVSGDVRSTCRAWQYEGAARELRARGIPAFIATNTPAPDQPLAGLFVGSAWVAPDQMGQRLPGFVGEHLTSMAGIFDCADQTKLTVWLQAGAAASSGAITEPFSIWTKFPHARFFAHYASGCSILESYFLSIGCPLQILLVGDPLVSPWGLNFYTVATPGAVTNGGGVLPVRVKTFGAPAGAAPDYQVFLDGRKMDWTGAPPIELDINNLADGYHELRVVALLPMAVRHQSYALCDFELNRRNRGVFIEQATNALEAEYGVKMTLPVRAEGEPSRLLLLQGEQVLAEVDGARRAHLSLDTVLSGPGPVRVQAAADYPDGERARSRPLLVNVRRPGKRQALPLSSATNTVDLLAAFKLNPGALQNERWSIQDGRLVYAGVEGSWDALMLPDSPDKPPQEFRGYVRAAPAWGGWKGQSAALAFACKDAQNFYFFGLEGNRCAWVLGACQKGRLETLAARGAPLKPQQEYEIVIKPLPDGGVECWVDGDLILSSKAVAWKKGALGVMAGDKERIEFRQLTTAPSPP